MKLKISSNLNEHPQYFEATVVLFTGLPDIVSWFIRTYKNVVIDLKN